MARDAADAIPAWVEGRLVPVDKLAVHRRGLRHKAVSVFAFLDGALLIQQRAAGKYHTPGLWSNTCCTHPRWEEAPGACARRRLAEELGLAGAEPLPRGRIEYRADVGGGMIEHEVVDIFTLSLDAPPSLAPDPSEVMDTRWITRAGLESEIAASPGRYTPWLRIYLSEHPGLVFPD